MKTPLYEIKYKIHKFIDNIIHPFRVAWYTTRNFLYWGWMLKDDRNWDFYYIYQILRIKLPLMRKCIAEGYAAKSHIKSVLKPLDRVIYLLKKLENGEYTIYHDKFEEKYGKLHLSFNPSKHPYLSSGYFWNEKCIYPVEQARANKAFTIAGKKDYEAQEKDRQELFKLLADNIEKWWD